jgi:hypothetical protein
LLLWGYAEVDVTGNGDAETVADVVDTWLGLSIDGFIVIIAPIKVRIEDCGLHYCG